ncbi:hypothetical protein [Streptomyces murinus]|uniref:hypothetical protein n=1 Tax=Streptomyces murinus TaxID=33900 RepID=UPI003F480553
MISVHSYTTDGLRDDVADPETWSVRICDDRCTTCIFRPGNLMHLAPGRVAALIKKAMADEGHIVCHRTLGTSAPAICSGFADHPRGRTASLALRLVRAGVLAVIPVRPDHQERS